MITTNIRSFLIEYLGSQKFCNVQKQTSGSMGNTPLALAKTSACSPWTGLLTSLNSKTVTATVAPESAKNLKTLFTFLFMLSNSSHGYPQTLSLIRNKRKTETWPGLNCVILLADRGFIGFIATSVFE